MTIAPCLPRNRPNRQQRIASAIALLPDAATMARRIDETYAQALDSEHKDGADWYSGQASGIAAIVASALEIDHEAGAAIVAALSPQCSWSDNVARALAFADGDHVGMGDPLRKAEAIAAGEDPSTVLGGRKVRSFWRNIVGHEAHVTVDRHAVAIVYGRALSDREIKVLERPGAYAYIAGAYRAAARRHGIAPSTLQAVTWLAWRRLKGDNDLGEF